MKPASPQIVPLAEENQTLVTRSAQTFADRLIVDYGRLIELQASIERHQHVISTVLKGIDSARFKAVADTAERVLAAARAGGHISFEAAFAPLLKPYSVHVASED